MQKPNKAYRAVRKVQNHKPFNRTMEALRIAGIGAGAAFLIYHYGKEWLIR